MGHKNVLIRLRVSAFSPTWQSVCREWQLALAVQSTGLRQSWQVRQLHASCEGGLLWPTAKPMYISLDQAV